MGTLRQVLEGSPIMLVLHDTGGIWQFLSNDPAEEDDVCVVSLGEIVATDPTLRELADLPAGWCAYREDSPEWTRAPAPQQEEDEEFGDLGPPEPRGRE